MGIETEKMMDDFLEKIENCFGTTLKEIGMTLTLRASIEFIFIDKRSDLNKWKESEQMLLYLSKEKKSKTFQQMAEKVEFKAKQWMVSCKKWNEMKSEYLSDSYINDYTNKNLK